jgi:hypothetical protein
MSARDELTGAQERQLRDCYATLHDLAGSVEVPSVLAAVRAALAELHAALDGQALDFEFYSHRWVAGEPAGAALRRAS